MALIVLLLIFYILLLLLEYFVKILCIYTVYEDKHI